MTRHKDRKVTVIEAEAKFVDVCAHNHPSHKVLIQFAAHSENYNLCRCDSSYTNIWLFLLWRTDETEVQGEVSSTTLPFDYLIYAVGAETQTFGIPGVKEHACFMKEIQDAEKVCSLSRTSILGKIQLCFLVQASLYGLYVTAPKRLTYRDLTTASGVESAGFPGQREEEIDRLLHMVRTVTRSHASSC
jgi:hypothetical protein